MYAAGWGTKQIYVLDADSLNIVDSIPFRGSPVLISANPNKECLYAMADDFGDTQTGTYVIDTKLKKVLHVDEERWFGQVARGGEYLIRTRRYDRGELYRAYLMDPLTFGIMDSLPDGLRAMDVINEGDSVLILEDESQILKLLDLRTGELGGSYRYSSFPYDSTYMPLTVTARVTPDGKTVVVITDYAIEIGDLFTGEMLYRKGGAYVSNGWIDISPSGTQAIVSIPTQDVWTESRPTELFVLNLESPRVLFSISGEDFQSGLRCGGICSFLPDGHRALVGGLSPYGNYGPLQVIDVDAGTVERWIEMPAVDPDVRCFAVGRATH